MEPMGRDYDFSIEGVGFIDGIATPFVAQKVPGAAPLFRRL